MKYVEWAEPWNMTTEENGYINYVDCIMKMRVENAVKWMHFIADKYHSEHPNYPYKNDEQALEDFIIMHGAYIKEYPDVCGV